MSVLVKRQVTFVQLYILWGKYRCKMFPIDVSNSPDISRIKGMAFLKVLIYAIIYRRLFSSHKG